MQAKPRAQLVPSINPWFFHLHLHFANGKAKPQSWLKWWLFNYKNCSPSWRRKRVILVGIENSLSRQWALISLTRWICTTSIIYFEQQRHLLHSIYSNSCLQAVGFIQILMALFKSPGWIPVGVGREYQVLNIMITYLSCFLIFH